MKLWSRLICLILVLIGLDSQSQIMLPAFQGAFKKADDADVIWNFRYVRVEFTATNHNGGRATMEEFWAYNCSGTDIALSSAGATAVAYGNSTSNAASSGGSETPGIAIDNSEGTRWMSSETIGTTNFDAINWVVDLQSPKLLTEIKLNIYQNNTFSFNVYGSTDNSSWVSMGTYSGTGQTYVSFTKAAPSLAIGDSFFGGKIAYLDGNGCGFVAATSEQSSYMQWGGYPGQYFATTTAAAIGTGLANTDNIITLQQDNIPANALDFDGSDDYVQISDHNTFDMSTTITIEAWINGSDFTSEMSILAKNNHWNFSILSGGRLAPSIYTSDWNQSQDSRTLSVNTWYHVAMVYDGSKIISYINGVAQEVLTLDGAMPTSTDDVFMGAQSASGGYFNGIIDEVRVWSDVRTQSEIQLNMNKDLPGSGHSNLVAYYNMNQGTAGGSNSGSLIDKNYPYGRTGTFNGFDLSGSTSNYVVSNTEIYSTAAGLCAGYSVTDGGVTYNDWYLPSKDELNQLYLNKAAIGGFDSGNYYWSSTANSNSSSWTQLSNGSQVTLHKSITYFVRAVRTF